MRTIKPDYSNCIVNFSNSLLKRFGVETFHSSIDEVDSLLAKHDKIVVVLFDGMGKALIERHLEPGSFVRKNVFATITSTFPATTVASTTGLLTARFPIENGWLGWSQYLRKFKCNVDLYTNENSVTKELVSSENEMLKLAPYHDILEMISDKNPEMHVSAVWPHPINGGSAKELDEFMNQIKRDASVPGAKLIYAYWTQPDSNIHKFGVDSDVTHQTIDSISREVEKLARELPDTLFLVLADHGLVDIEFLMVEEHPDFYATQKRLFSNEPRASFFFVKKGCRREFVRLFKKYYGQWFILKNKKQFLSDNWFGEGKPHEIVNSFLGDYLAIATDHYCFDYLIDNLPAHAKFKAHHAGLTEDEMLIDLIAINK